MEIILSIFILVLWLVIATIIISFLLNVPTELGKIATAMQERNRIEKQKLEIMKNNIKENNNEWANTLYRSRRKRA